MTTPPAPRVPRAGPLEPGRAGAAGGVAIRPAAAGDLEACARLWQAATRDYLGRLNQPDAPADLVRLGRFLDHLRSTDPDRFVVAWQDGRGGAGPAADGGKAAGRLAGFASAVVRGRCWFLAMLFVEPAEQGAGIGRALLDATLAGLPRPDGDDWSFGAATDSVQPISNALYARYGIVPRVPVLPLVGAIVPGSVLPRLPAGVRALPADGAGPPEPDVEAALAAVDRAVLGYEHPQDHAWFRDDRRLAVLYATRAGVVGYGYASAVGRVGPIAALDPAHLPAITADLLARVRPIGAQSVWVPGSAGATVAMLLRSGYRLDGFPSLLCWSRPFVDTTRYVPGSLALL